MLTIKRLANVCVSKNSADLIMEKVEPIELFFWPAPAAWAIIIGAIAVVIAAVWRGLFRKSAGSDNLLAAIDMS